MTDAVEAFNAAKAGSDRDKIEWLKEHGTYHEQEMVALCEKYRLPEEEILKLFPYRVEWWSPKRTVPQPQPGQEDQGKDPKGLPKP